MISKKLKALFEDDEMGLLDVSKKSKPQTSSDRLEASFLEIVDFYNENGREPESKSSEMAERKLGVRLHGIRADEEKCEALKHLDNKHLLDTQTPSTIDEVFSDDDGLLDDPTGILTLRNVPKTIKTPDYIATRVKTKDFEEFEPLFINCQAKLRDGSFKLVDFKSEREIQPKKFYVVKGVLAYIEVIGEKRRFKSGSMNARMRVIFENGTESDVLLRSFATKLYEDGKIVVDPSVRIENGGLFANIESKDSETGYIYVLSSLSEDPKIANVSNLYKVGFSSTNVEQRIKTAATDPTYLMAPVKIRASYKSYNMNPQKLEAIIHRVFSEARLDLDMTDSSGKQYQPSEWFVAPIEAIDVAIHMIVSGDIVHYHYDKVLRAIVPNKDGHG